LIIVEEADGFGVLAVGGKSLKIKMMKLNFCSIVFLLLLTTCHKDKELSMKAIPYTGDELKINGYYYKNKGEYSHVLVFFANGVQFGSNGILPSNDIENILRDPDFTKRFGNKFTVWGAFEINNNDLRFEFYSIFNGHDWRTCIAHCEILNDTTFYIEKTTFSKTGKEVNDEGSTFLGEYRFKQFSPKPDSTNNFIP